MWIRSFIDYLKFERNYSNKTLRCYEDDLKTFEKFFKELDSTLKWDTLDADVVRNWMVSMMDAGSAATSVNRRLSSLRSFFRFLLKRGMVGFDPVRGVQGPKKKKPLPVFVRESDMDRLLDGNCFADSFEGRRDRLILDLFYSTGMRLSELTGLNVEDIDLVTDNVKVTGKRNKQRIIPFGEELHVLLETYISERRILADAVAGATSALFVDAKGVRLQNIKVWRLVRYYLGLVSTFSKRSPHVLRHTFATSMLNHHADLEALKELLGHESISTTEIYTHTTFEELKEMYNQAHPRA
ncbi:MAG TPA: tyrosine recombinase XerC [Candidatus Paraprevotella stercorigallinarum]|nr:tyrosine recombinase XerC [Candidatus Paraprevotella stercorigallinarum]